MSRLEVNIKMKILTNNILSIKRSFMFNSLIYSLLLVLFFGITFSSMAIEEDKRKADVSGAYGQFQSLKFSPGDLKVLLKVKEVAGVGAREYPTTAVVPLPFGIYYDVNSFRVVDTLGNTVSAQFNVLNRWWARDKSIRHVTVHFQPTVSAFNTSGTGISTYYLRDDGKGNNINTRLSVIDNKASIEVITGPIKFTINRDHFTIIEELWLDSNSNAVFEDSEQLILAGADSGGMLVGRLPGDIQYDSTRDDVKVVIEEAGPMRAVIRAEALTRYIDTENHTHGFAVRIYAYANKPYVKIDYQLQNSAKNKKHAWSLYFEEMGFNFKLNLDRNPTVRVGTGDGSVYKRTRNNGIYLAQESHDTANVYDMKSGTALKKSDFNTKFLSNNAMEGFIDVSDAGKGVSAMIRYLWQTWPNGLSIDQNNTFSLQLFPSWSAQHSKKYVLSPTGLYNLEDMQHTYKETMLYFHGSRTSNNDLINLSKTFNYHPVVTISTSWYQQTQATLDMGGLIPFDKRIVTKDERLPKYKPVDFERSYKFNWDNFYLFDKGRKWNTASGGSWPKSVSKVIATENPSDYYFAEQFVMGELNVRPHWMSEYTYEKDYDFIQLSKKLPFIIRSWRRYNSGSKRKFLAAEYLKGTWGDASPRDNAHGWYYHVEEAYYLTANPWIRDWHRFIGEVRKGTLFDPRNNELASRGVGHMLGTAIQAYRVTGDMSILKGVRNYFDTRLRVEQKPLYGFRNSLCCGKYGEAAFQAGYLIRAMVNYMEEVYGTDWQAYAEAFQFVSGYMEWNYNISNFSYYIDARNGDIGSSDGTSFTFVDPQAWYYLNTGKQKYLDQLNEYFYGGINGGKGPIGNLTKWKGEWVGRYSQFVLENTKSDTTPPNAIIDLTVARDGKNNINMTWTTPTNAIRFHVVYSDKPISEELSTDKKMTNWWAANVIGPELTATPGMLQSLSASVDQDKALYVAMFTFDRNRNMSVMSNVATVLDVMERTKPGIPQNVSANAVSDTEIDVVWKVPADPVLEINKYIIYRDGLKIGESPTASFADTGLSDMTSYSYQISAVNYAGLIGPKSTLTFVKTLADTIPPTVTSVRNIGGKTIIAFSEPVEKKSAENIGNYMINNKISVKNAVLDKDLKTVELTTSAQIDGVVYSLTVSNVLDRAGRPNVVAYNTIGNYTSVSRLIINNLTTLSGKMYEVVPDKLQAKKGKTYIDRKYVFDFTPAFLKNATYIKTACDDKTSSGNEFVTFVVNQDVTVYVAHADRIESKPEWLNSFIDTGGNLVSDSNVLSLYVKDFPVGRVTLGGNEGSKKSAMYSIVVVGRGLGANVLPNEFRTDDAIPTKNAPFVSPTTNGTISGNQTVHSQRTVTEKAAKSVEKPPQETTSLTTISVSTVTPFRVDVVFSKPVEVISARTASNYNIDNGIKVLDATLGSDSKTVTLTTSSHSSRVSYTLTVNNIKDLASEPNVIPSNTMESYTFVADSVVSSVKEDKIDKPILQSKSKNTEEDYELQSDKDTMKTEKMYQGKVLINVEQKETVVEEDEFNKAEEGKIRVDEEAGWDSDEEGVEDEDLQMTNTPFQDPEIIWLPHERKLTKRTKGSFAVRIRIEGVEGLKASSSFPRIRYYIGTSAIYGYFDMTHEGAGVWQFGIPDPGWYQYRSKTLYYQVGIFNQESKIPIAESVWQTEFVDSFAKGYD